MNKKRLWPIVDRLVKRQNVRGYRVVCGDSCNALPTDYTYNAWLLIKSDTYGYFLWKYINHTTDSRWWNESLFWLEDDDAHELIEKRTVCGGSVWEIYDHYEVLDKNFRNGTPCMIHTLFNTGENN